MLYLTFEIQKYYDAYGLLRATHFHNPGIYLLNAVMFSSFKVKS